MNNFQKALCSVLDPESDGIEFISKGLNRVTCLYKGHVYDQYADLPKTARFAIARAIQPYSDVYTELREQYSVLEAEERLVWCLFGSFDGSADISNGIANYELSGHCTRCQYAKPFCHRVLNHLTARQQECFILMRRGLTDKEVACQLGISPLTVIKHMTNAVERIRDYTGLNISRQYIINQLTIAGL